MADPLILGLYALSRSIAGDRLRKKEKEAMKPITYVRVGNETVDIEWSEKDFVCFYILLNLYQFLE